MSRSEQAGFTLIELLIVVAIIGLLSAIAVPSLLNAVDRGKQSGTVADMRAIATALERYAIDNNGYPTHFGALAESLEPGYITLLPRADDWGNGYVYAPGTGGQAYSLRSLGKDGTLQGSPGFGTTHAFEDDIILVDGQFVQWPAGQQD